MIMKMYAGMKPFLEPIKITKVDASDDLRPTKKSKEYIVQGSVALIDGTETFFRPGGKVLIGDLYLQTTAGGINAQVVGVDNTFEMITLEEGDVIHHVGNHFEIKYVRDEPTIIDIADFYASKQEVMSNV